MSERAWLPAPTCEGWWWVYDAEHTPEPTLRHLPTLFDVTRAQERPGRLLWSGPLTPPPTEAPEGARSEG